MLRTIMFWTGNPSNLLLEDTPHHQQEGSEKSPVSMGSTSDPNGTDKSGTDEVGQVKSGTSSGQEGVTFGTTTGSEEKPAMPSGDESQGSPAKAR